LNSIIVCGEGWGASLSVVRVVSVVRVGRGGWGASLSVGRVVSVVRVGRGDALTVVKCVYPLREYKGHLVGVFPLWFMWWRPDRSASHNNTK
jgi:hypothetical protein